MLPSSVMIISKERLVFLRTVDISSTTCIRPVPSLYAGRIMLQSGFMPVDDILKGGGGQGRKKSGVENFHLEV